MKKCPICGVPVGTQEEKCHVCGVNIKRVEGESFYQQQTLQTNAAGTAVYGAEQAAPKKSALGSYIAIGVLILALIAGCVMMLFKSANNEDIFDVATIGATTTQIEDSLGKPTNETSDTAATYIYYENSDLCGEKGQMMYAFINDSLFGAQWYKQYDSADGASNASKGVVKHFSSKYGKVNSYEESGATVNEWKVSDTLTFYVTTNDTQLIAYFIDYSAIYGASGTTAN